MKENILKRILLIILVGFICTQSIFAEGTASVDTMTDINEGQTITTITVGNAETIEGNEIAVPISISNNTGLMGLTLSVEYDSDSLTLTRIVRGEALSGLAFTKPGDLSLDLFKLLWDGTDADSTNGSIVSLEFTIADDVQYTEDLIDVTVVTACDNDMEDVETVVNQGILQSNFRLEDALETEDTSGIIPKTIYNVDLLPTNYLNYMNELGSETTNYVDGSVSASGILYDYEITSINLRDDEDNSVDRLINGGVLQSVTIEGDGTDDIILAVAQYNGQTLTKLLSYEITLSNGKDVVMTNYDLLNINGDTSIKLFVWDSYSGMEPKANPIILFTENDIEISVSFMYDDIYTEKAFIRGKTIQAQVCARSTKWWSQAISLYIALYDENNKLISVAHTNGNILSDGNYQFIDVELPLSQDLPEGCTIKTFVWESESMKPYLEHETVISADDYHADNIQNARYIDMSKLIKGVINTSTDKDCIKFIPTVTQNYFIQSFGDEQLEINLYSSDGTKITTNNSHSESIGTIIEQNLTEGELYYIEISGTAQSEYMLAITPNMILGISNCSFDTTQGDFCTIPIAVSNANSLENINFSVHYSDADFELYDACDMTDAIENTSMQTVDGLIDIIDVQPNYITFKSLKTELLETKEIINIVKLKAKQSALSTVYVRAYIQ